MTQDGFAAAERIAATLDAVGAALVGERATHYSAATLAGFRRTAHRSADALFGLRISPGGPGLLTVHGLGQVVETGSRRGRQAGAGAEAVAALRGKLGAGPVLGAGDGASAAAFQLPVAPEPADAKLRPAFAPALAALASPRATAAPDELSTGSGVEARLVVPSVFHPLSVRGAGTALAAHLTEVAEELFAGARPARRDWALLAAALADEFAAADVQYAGLSALTVDGQRSRASLVVSLARHPLPVQELAVALSTERPHAEVWTVLLPAGPAALLVEARTAPVPATLTADGQRGWVVSSVVEAFLPLPDGSTVLTVQLSTPQAEHWELYTEAFAELLQSVQLGWDGVVTAPPAAVPAAAPATPTPPPSAPAAPVTPPPAAPTPVPVTAEPAVPQTAPAPVPVTAEPVAPQAAPPAAPVDAAPPAPRLASTDATLPAQAAAPLEEQDPARRGTPVAIPPADFDPFAPQPPAAATAAGTPAAAPADPFGALPPQAPAPAAEQDPARRGTPVAIPPPDFDPFAPQAPAATTAAPAAPAEQDPARRGTPVAIPPPDFDPFAPQPPAAAAPADEQPRSKGTPVNIPPPDFDPFAPQAPSTAAAAPAAGKGTPVAIPPADFDPFAASASPSTPAPAAAPAPVAAAPAPAAVADPFGTVVGPADPFGTVTTPQPAAPAPVAPPMPTTPPTVGTPAAGPGKGTPVNIPPPDFDPFAPQAPAAEAPAGDEAPKTRGTPVNIPPPDFDPFANLSAPPAAPAAPAQPAAPEPPANSPFG
ncbi:hypothetical protein [Kitasatospora terrestris]|uniref:Uncharacterized protein n=1 Tax=Kitasatospora terrestris TaxID=258051 RepID=A0ABP9DER4_9ACTN